MRIPNGRLPEPEQERIKHITVSAAWPAVNLKIYGEKDRRGPDNNVRVWVTEDRSLHIRVQKEDRCYPFKEVIETPGYIEIVQEY